MKSNEILKQITSMLPTQSLKLYNSYIDNVESSLDDTNGPGHYYICREHPMYYLGFFIQIDTINRVVDEGYKLRGEDIDLIKTFDTFTRLIRSNFIDIISVGLHLDFKKLVSIIIRDTGLKRFFFTTNGYERFTIGFIEQNYCTDNKFDITNKDLIDKLSIDLNFGYYLFKGQHYLDRLLAELIPVIPMKNYTTVDDLDENDVLVISI